MDDWRIKAGLDQSMVEMLPPVLWLSGYAKDHLLGNGRRSEDELKLFLGRIAAHHVELTVGHFRQTGRVPTAMIGVHQEPCDFLPHCLVTIHGVPFTKGKVVIVRDDEAYADITDGRIPANIFHPVVVGYLWGRNRQREILQN